MKRANWLTTRPDWQWLLLIGLLALALRLPNIGRDSLWLDEAISYLTAALPLPAILNNSVQSSHPPAYYLALAAFRQLGIDSDAALRLLSLLWNLLLIPLLYRLALDLFARRSVALLAALLLALSPFQLLYSHELRMYTQLMFWGTLGCWGYWRARQENGRYWLLFVLAFLVAVYTHLFAWLLLAAVGLHALWYRRAQPRAFWLTALLTAGLLLCFTPWILQLLAESQTELGSLRPLNAENSRNPIKPIVSFTFLLFGLSSNYYFSGVALFLSLAFLVVLLLESRRLRQQPGDPGLTLLLLAVGTTLGVPLLIYMVRPFFLPERTMAVAAPFLLLLFAWGLTRPRTPLPWLAGTAALVMAVGVAIYHLGPPLKPPYREAMAYVAAQVEPGDAVLHSSDGSYLPALRYAGLPAHALLANDPDPRKPLPVYTLLNGEVWPLAQATAWPGRLWLVVALEHSVEWQQEQVAQITAVMQIIDQQQFGGIMVYELQLP